MRYLVVCGWMAAQCVGAAPSLAQTAAPAKPPGLQDMFNTATAAWEGGDCAAALPLFAQLAKDPRVKLGSLPAAAIAVRRGDCLARTGQVDEGETLIASGLPQLRAGGENFAKDVALAELQLGQLAMQRWDHDSALAHFDAALALQQGQERLAGLNMIAKLTAFDGGQRGLSAAEEGLKLEQAAPKPDKQRIGEWQAPHASILLNQGKVKEGYAELKTALRLQSNGSADTSLGEAVLFADLAQAAMLNHDSGEAYLNMAKSGAGRLDKAPFAKAASIDLPECGPDTGLDPQDSAVVLFAIDADGSVSDAQTIYTTGTYAKAAAFASAVKLWNWKPEDAAKMPAFFRYSARVELRCTSAQGSGGAWAGGPLKQRFAAWTAQQEGGASPAEGATASWRRWLVLAEAAQAKGQIGTELAARTFLATDDLRSKPEALASIERAFALLALPDVNVTAEARAAARVFLTKEKNAWIAASARKVNVRSQPIDTALLALADDPQIAADALAQTTAVLLAVPARPVSSDAERSMAAVRRVALDERLGEHHPLRQLAQLRLANDAARAGDLSAAQTWFAKTGLNQEQCALIGPRPALTQLNTSDYPYDALAYGFEGWVQTKFDIQADGRTAATRAVIAYPPLIFVKSATAKLSTARYQSSFRPEGGAACSANRETLSFKISGNENTAKVITTKPKRPKPVS